MWHYCWSPSSSGTCNFLKRCWDPLKNDHLLIPTARWEGESIPNSHLGVSEKMLVLGTPISHPNGCPFFGRKTNAGFPPSGHVWNHPGYPNSFAQAMAAAASSVSQLNFLQAVDQWQLSIIGRHQWFHNNKCGVPKMVVYTQQTHWVFLVKMINHWGVLWGYTT